MIAAAAPLCAFPEAIAKEYEESRPSLLGTKKLRKEIQVVSRVLGLKALRKELNSNARSYMRKASSTSRADYI